MKNIIDTIPLLSGTWDSLKKQMEIIEKQLLQGKDINFRGEHGRSLLSIASLYSYSFLVDFLIERGADVNLADNRSLTPLMFACTQKGLGAIKCIKSLLDHGAHIDSIDIYGRTPLMVATNANLTKNVKYLLSRGANEGIKDVYGKTPFLYTAHYGLINIMTLYIQRGVDINEVDQFGNTALMLTMSAPIQSFNIACSKLLLEHGVDLSIKNNEGYTAMELAQQHRGKSANELLQFFSEQAALKELLSDTDDNSLNSGLIIF